MTDRTAEYQRLKLKPGAGNPWRLWGPYLAERQWGTVREDYSPEGTAWEYFTHDQARSRAYRWGEDGLAGICDDQQRLCFAFAFWNGKDAILKERIFGLTNSEGNHGEDVKELYYYLDATPSHAYLKLLYKYPQRAFPYEELVRRNAERPKTQGEFEILDTGIFDDDRYFDVVVEYAKASPDDLVIQITVENRGPDKATLHVLPHLWFRNTWSWKEGQLRPELKAAGPQCIRTSHPSLGDYELILEKPAPLLFCENDTNHSKLYGAPPIEGGHKDGINDWIVEGRRDGLNKELRGTKSAVHFQLKTDPRGSASLMFRLRKRSAEASDLVSKLDRMESESFLSKRRLEADEFYGAIQEDLPDSEARRVQRQALAGMIWSKQFFHLDVRGWIDGDPAQPAPPPNRAARRNHEWGHFSASDVLSMPDKWEYPWFAAWDLAFHCIPLALIDPAFAKEQLVLLTREWYMHPNGQLPAYEWAFGDVNPPVHAWAAWRVFQIDRKQRRRRAPGDPGDVAFLERVFHKLLLNFTWWVNRKDAQGRNVFQGGFLGLDNIGVFDRSKPLPTGGFINQADGTSWMAMYALNLMRMALEISKHNPVYQDVASKFFEHFLHIAAAMNHMGREGVGLWDPKDEFYYDVLQLEDGTAIPLKIRSMVGLIPLFAVEVLEPELAEQAPEFHERLEWFLENRPELAGLVSRWNEPGQKHRRLLSLLRGHRMKCLLKRMLDETEFLSPYGVRALSQCHRDHPYRFHVDGATMEVGYQPAESTSGLFGGNSNWRGPIWMPVNYLLIESIQRFHHYYGDDFKVECPTGSGKYLTLDGIAGELTQRLTRLFMPDAQGERPAMKGHAKQSRDSHFKNCLLFHEYFHGDSGLGIGASHQTGWTGLIAKLLQRRADG